MTPDHLQAEEVVRALDDAGVVHAFSRPRPAQGPMSGRRRFARNMGLYMAAAFGVALVLVVLAGLTGGPWGLFAFLVMLGIALLLLVPGALLATAVLTWLSRRPSRPPGLVAALIAGGISAVWLAAVVGVIATFYDLGPDPSDARLLSGALVVFGAVIGSIAGVAISRAPTPPAS